MRRLFILALLWTVIVAKPGTYKEKEDFEYSRSSSDEGSKSGYYGAQRGNMGGNYERAHNMDSLAQNQMSGVVRQVEGELGDGAKTRTGSVYSSANSRGIYGSGTYDLTNLAGRNFQEGVSYGDAQSHSSSLSHSGYNTQSSADLSTAHHSSHSHNSRYQSEHSGYHSGSSHSGQDLQSSNLLSTDNLQTAQNYDYGGQDLLGYYSNTGYHGSNNYAQSASDLYGTGSYGTNDQTKIIRAMPVRVVVRPGTRVAIPITSQSYDSTHRDSSFSQNDIVSETEMSKNRNHQANTNPSNNGKHYQSSYSYRKEWEKHDTSPVVMSTVSPSPKTNELYEDNQAMNLGRAYESNRLNLDNTHSNSDYRGYENYARSASSSQSRHQSHYNTQREDSTSASNLNLYDLQKHEDSKAAALNLNSQVEDFSSQPKSYQASYSYHKSWERQGDPYIIKPIPSNTLTSQRLSASDNQYGSHHHGSQYSQSQQNYNNGNVDDCDVNGHIRVPRSYSTQNQITNEEQAQNFEDFGQQSQSQWDTSSFGQQIPQKWDHLEDGQQNQYNWDELEHLSQQSQNKWNLGNDEQHVQSNLNNLENLGQQTQNQWDEQITGQEEWNNFEQSPQNKHLDQQEQNLWTTVENGPFELHNKTEYGNERNNNILKNENSFQYNNKDINQGMNTDAHRKLETPKETVQDSRNVLQDNTEKFIEPYHSENIDYPKSEHSQSHIYHESHTSQTNNWNYSTSSFFTHKNSLDKSSSETRGWGSSSLRGLWDKIENIDKLSNNNINNFENKISLENMLKDNKTQENKSFEYDQLRNGNYNVNLSSSYKSTTPTNSNINEINESTNSSKVYETFHKDIGRGDIDPEDLDEQDPMAIPYTTTTSTNIPHNADIKNMNKSEKNTDISAADINNNWFKNENKHIIFEVSSTPKSPDIRNLSPEDVPLENINIEKQSKKERMYTNINNNDKFKYQYVNKLETQSENSDDQKGDSLQSQYQYNVNSSNSEDFEQNTQNNNFNESNKAPHDSFDQIDGSNPEKFRQHSDDFVQKNINPAESLFKQEDKKNLGQLDQQNNFNQQNVAALESFDQQNLNTPEQFEQHNDEFVQKNVDAPESFNQQNMDNLDQFEQQSNNFDQQNVTPLESFDQQNLGNLEQFEQHSDDFVQKNVNPLESFNQPNMENLEQFDQQINNFDQQNVSPLESFDQQNIRNLEQFEQHNDEFVQKNVDAPESFNQQNMDNLEQFEQQSNGFDQQNVTPLESFDQQNLGNLEQFEQHSDDLVQKNVNPLESFNQQNMENLEQFDQQINNFDQQNVAPLESFDQQNIRNLEQFEQHNDEFVQKNVDAPESFNQQNVDNLEQFEQHSDDFVQRNVGPQEAFPQQSDDLILPVTSKSQSPLTTLVKKPDDSEIDVGKGKIDNLFERTDELVIPLMESGHKNPQSSYTLQSEHLKQETEKGRNGHFKDQQLFWTTEETRQEQTVHNYMEGESKQQMYNSQYENMVPVKQGRENDQVTDTNKSSETLDSTPESITEKPGFWKSIGNKFVSAKDKVASWFSKS